MMKLLIVGFGFMAGKHARVIQNTPDASIPGVVDPRGEGIRETLGAAGLGGVPVFPDLESALGAINCDAVVVCLPTDLHRKAAELAFSAGCHVFCEKPIALTVADAQAMEKAAEIAGRELMVGHCIRFWPEYEALASMVRTGELGRLASLSLSRRSERPDYAVGDWVNQPERCVGAALDLHIHDTDFVCHLLGTPRAVGAHGIREPAGWNSIATTYDFEGPLVFADAAWNYPKGWGFQMRFSAVFENGALDYDSRAVPSLLVTRGNEPPAPFEPGTPPGDGYRREMEYFIACIQAGRPIEKSNGAQATTSLAITLAEIESAARGGISIPCQTQPTTP